MIAGSGRNARVRARLRGAGDFFIRDTPTFLIRRPKRSKAQRRAPSHGTGEEKKCSDMRAREHRAPGRSEIHEKPHARDSVRFSIAARVKLRTGELMLTPFRAPPLRPHGALASLRGRLEAAS